eukprot:gnl/MRDRNA2_/MRDRNA2_27752_c0_seq1.p1 gnl/MRDRNA2_/MRDRNA2_27752_c0~~gnl/MRDRNA2_/MRDRNA2_27752_c0_seq1.p1  ORF type:complete len:1011 (-),score=195.54 gnl/MRDRNA2_/MRDRNA2_27752_c0_seq1:144-3176(-)
MRLDQDDNEDNWWRSELHNQMRQEVFSAKPLDGVINEKRPPAAQTSPLHCEVACKKVPKKQIRPPVFGSSTERTLSTSSSRILGTAGHQMGGWMLSPDNPEQLKERLLEQFGSLFCAWQKLDPEARGFLGREEFRKALCGVGYNGKFSLLWQAMDAYGQGLMTLSELDSDLAFQLMQLKQLVVPTDGLKKTLLRVGAPQDVLAQDLSMLFQYLRMEKPQKLAKEFAASANGNASGSVAWFDKWTQASGPTAPEIGSFLEEAASVGIDDTHTSRFKMSGGLHVPMMTTRALQHATERWQARRDLEIRQAQNNSMDVAPVSIETLHGNLRRRHGNLVRAWRREVVADLVFIGWRQFVRTLRRLSYRGSLSDALIGVHAAQSGIVELSNFAAEEYSLLVEFRRWIDNKFGSVELAWGALDVYKVKRLPRATFSARAKELGYIGDCRCVFEYLVLDTLSGKTGQGDYHAIQQVEFMWLNSVQASSDGKKNARTDLEGTEGQSNIERTGNRAEDLALMIRRAQRCGVELACGAKIPSMTVRALENIQMGHQQRKNNEDHFSLAKAKDSKIKNFEDFKLMLTRTHGNLVRAWRHMFEGKGTMGRMNFVRAMKTMNYGGDLREAWTELSLSASDVITLTEFAPAESAELVEFRRCLLKRWGDAKSAFKALDEKHRTRVPKKAFIAAVKSQLDFEGDVAVIFDYLTTNGCVDALTEDEFVWLDQWQSRSDIAVKNDPRRTALTGVSQLRSSSPAKDENEEESEKINYKQAVNELLAQHSGSVGRAWRSYLDPCGSGILCWSEFIILMKRINMKLNLTKVWLEIVPHGEQEMTLRHLVPDVHDALLRVYGVLADPELPESFWMFQGASEQETPVGEDEFRSVLAVLGVESDIKHAFDTLADADGKMVESGGFRWLAVWGGMSFNQGYGTEGILRSNNRRLSGEFGEECAAHLDVVLRRHLGLTMAASSPALRAGSGPRRSELGRRRSSMISSVKRNSRRGSALTESRRASASMRELKFS